MSSSQTIEEPNNNFKIELFIEDIDNGDLEILKTLINNIKNNNNHSKKKKKKKKKTIKKKKKKEIKKKKKK